MDVTNSVLRKRAALLAAMVCLLLAVSIGVMAQKDAGALISLDVADIELVTVVMMLARDSGQNIVIADHEKLHTKVSATLTDVSLDTALRYIVQSAGCSWSREADGTYIIGAEPKLDTPKMSEPKVTAVADTVSYEPPSIVRETRRDLKFESIKLYNSSPVDMMWLLGAYSPEQALAIQEAPVKPGVYIPRSPISQQHGTPPLLDPLVEVINESQRMPGTDAEAGQQPPIRPPGTTNQPTQPGAPNQPGTTQSLTPDGIEYMMPFPADNSLLVKGTPEGIEELHELIKKLDVAPQQISIKAEFVEISTSETTSLGIDWVIQRMGSVLETSFGPTGNVSFGYANGNVMANLKTQVFRNKAKLVNAPIISTLNNTPANISIQKQIPYWTSSGYYGTGTSTTTQQVNTLSINSTLMVLPRVNGDGSITVTLQPQVSDQGEMFTGPDGTQLPAVNQQYLSTTRRVMNGETIVVGGIIRKTDNSSLTGIPLLKDLPIVGPLFQNRNRSTEDRELLIFLTPTIVPERSTAGTGIGVSL